MSVTSQEIAAELKRLIPRNPPAVLVHSSLSSFGHVEGGAESVIAALKELCAGGTLLMPTLSFASIDEASPVFDVIATKSDTGRITEVFRTQPGVLRSRHIVSSAAAWGACARAVTAGHLDTPCGPDSPYRRLIELDGFVLFLGACFRSNTLFHCAEEAVSPAYLRYHTFRGAQVICADGSVLVHDFRRYDCSQMGITRHLYKMERIFRSRGAVVDAHIGPCPVMLISARENFAISCALLRDDPDYILQEDA